MLAFGVLVLLLPVILLAIALGGAWMEGRRSPHSFGIGRVISNAFGAIGGAPLALLAASAVLNAPMQFLLPTMAQRMGDTAAIQGLAYSMAPLWLIWLFVYPFIKLFMMGIALDTLASRPIEFGAMLRMALRRTLPALALLILFGIALAVGFVLLVVPGIILGLTWFIVLPVMAGEGRGIFDCFGRSADLLRGMRWRLLLLILIAVVLWMMASGLTQGIALAAGGAQNLWLVAGVQAVFATLIGVLTTTGTAAVYHEVRTAKEGMGSHDLEAVFA
ncbi:hypothetical protein ASE90_16015 [Sphingomonas sp. Leaf67]|uniref:hypothetical protein n=1 Tax=Sphingomonas sp. Leaf67 TaxID=1736230 RepID=UPI0006FE96B2|nr:hypothetical protein [Sphingomonas sp. Leaf67]KQN79838.1 hypothetical protein ASE90_16015 [Sphingomonas sp. Leaf67]